MNGPWHGGPRILRLARGDPDELGAGEGEVDGEHCGEDSAQALREKTIRGQVAQQRCRVVSRIGNDSDDRQGAQHDEGEDRQDLDRGQEGLGLREDPH